MFGTARQLKARVERVNTQPQAVTQTRPDFANRLSYVIGQDGKIAYCYQNLNPDRHVERMLAAVRALPKAPAR